MFYFSFQVPVSAQGGCFPILTKKRGIIFEQNQVPGTQQMVLKAHLPVMESFGRFNGKKSGRMG